MPHPITQPVRLVIAMGLESEMPVYRARTPKVLRFDKFIRSSMIVRDVKQMYPHTVSIFEEFGFRAICDDCSIDVVAQRQGLATFAIVDALNQAILPREGYQE